MAVNKVILLGNLGKDPELRMTNQQMAVCNFSLATGERRKEGGNWVDHTEWHNIVAFGKTAELCAQYLKKGRQVFIEGKITTRKWQDKEGRDRYTTEIIANSVQFIGGARGTGAGEGAATQAVTMEATSSPDVAMSPEAIMASMKTADALSSSKEVKFDDDDIPF